MQRALLIIAAWTLCAGCAREALPPETAPAPAYQGPYYPVWQPNPPAGAPLPPMVGFQGVSAPASSPLAATPAPVAWQPRTLSSKDIPAGERCLELLDQANISYRKLAAKRGVETPVEVTSEIGGVRYESGAGQALVLDCRLAVALERVAPVLRSLGVSRMRFSGAYSYRMSRVGRLSLHAYGLAIDVHQIAVGGSELDVRRDFGRGMVNGCAPEAPALNQIACRLKATGMFRELLTPDFNADHWDHFHLGVDPLSGSPVGTVVKKDKPAPPKHAPENQSAPKPPEPAKLVEPTPSETVADAGEPVFVPDEPPSDEPEFIPDSKPAQSKPKQKPKKSAPAHHKRPKRSARAHGPKHKT